jgi:hypothetical protein
LVIVEVAEWRIAVGFGVPAAFKPAVANEPMTGQRRVRNPAPAGCGGAAKTRQVVIAMHDGVARPRRDAP